MSLSDSVSLPNMSLLFSCKIIGKFSDSYRVEKIEINCKYSEHNKLPSTKLPKVSINYSTFLLTLLVRSERSFKTPFDLSSKRSLN